MSRTKKQAYLRDPLPPGTLDRARWNAILHPRVTHGGPASRGKRKTKRPYLTKCPQFFCLSSNRARGPWGLTHRKNHSRIQAQIYTYAKRFRVRVFLARVRKNGIELLVKAHDRKDLADFFRVLAGRVAIGVTGAKKGVRKIGKFWNELCFSKLLNWGAEFHALRNQLLSPSAKEAPLRSLVSVLTPKTTGS